MSEDELPSYVKESYLTRLTELSNALEQNNHDRANQLIGELTTLRESSLFQELGKLTREIHESINAFSDDDRVAELASEEIPDAKERLGFIVSKTDDAAHRTIANAEQTVDFVNAFNERASDLNQRWKQFTTQQMSKADFLALSDDIGEFLNSIEGESTQVKSKMTDIMMAQDYQDLTGQMIKQVTNMVQEIEEKLVRLVAITGSRISEVQEKDERKDGTMAHGPQLPTADKAEVATNQDEVDDLLASLGF